jgi:hypothetical protein
VGQDSAVEWFLSVIPMWIFDDEVEVVKAVEPPGSVRLLLLKPDIQKGLQERYERGAIVD